MRLLKHWPLGLVVIAWFAFSLVTFKDYGITFDENTEYRWGYELLKHYSQDTKFNNTISPVYEGEEKHQRHTPVLSQYYRLYPALLNLVNVRHTYEFFHLLNMLFATLLLVGTYFLMYEKFHKPLLAIIGPLFVLLVPNLLGHIPANPKDMPFAVVFFLGLIAIYLSERIKNEYLKILFLGIAFGLVQSFRTVGFSIYIIYLAYTFYLNHSIKNVTSKVMPMILVFIVANFVMAITWPYIGVNFINNSLNIFQSAQDYEYWNKSQLYFGQYITPETRPWHYLPVLIGLTTPLSILGLAVAGLIPKKESNHGEIKFLLIFALAINFALYLILKPIIYNGIRHFLFLLPLISTLGAITFVELLQKKTKFAKIIVVGVIVNLGIVASQLWVLHPYQYIYFNEWAQSPNWAQTNFEYEYWGASYKEATLWLNQNIGSETEYKVYTCANSFAVEYYLQPHLKRHSDASGADFIVCDYARVNDFRGYKELYVVSRNGVPLNYVLAPSTDK